VQPSLHHTSYSVGRDSIRDKNGQITDDGRLRSSLSLFNAARQKRGAQGHSLRAALQSDPAASRQVREASPEINPRLDTRTVTRHAQPILNLLRASTSAARRITDRLKIAPGTRLLENLALTFADLTPALGHEFG